MEGGKSEPGTVIGVTVKFGGRLIPVSVGLDSAIKDLKALLQPLTDVLPRGQKLIFKGKLLADEMTLRKSEVTDGAKIMLLASQGLHQGDGPMLKKAATRPISRDKMPMTDKGKAIVPDKNRLERWKSTGVVALAECNLKVMPDDVWACGSSTRVLDVSNNSIRELPSKLGCLSGLQKIIMNGNDISDESICWGALTSLKRLTTLNLSHNHLTILPKELGALNSLKQLHVSNNKLTSLPVEIGLLTGLEVLRVNNNRISTIDPSIGSCISLIEVDLSANLLTDLPETFGNLRNLKALQLGNNGLRTLPTALFKSCLQLSILDLHNTEITMEVLRHLEGWEEFDRRRCSKHQKQLDFRVMGSGEFDEGADEK